MNGRARDRAERLITRLLPRRLLRSQRLFEAWEERGFHVTPVHFYQPIPDTRQLSEELWERASECVGLEWNDVDQLSLLHRFESLFKTEYEAFPVGSGRLPHTYFVKNRFFETVEGEILYCMIRYLRPRRIYEVGSGYSTYLAAQAVCRNKEDSSYDCELVAIDPYANEVVRSGFPGLSRVITQPIEHVGLSFFDNLESGDFLFIDSSHVVKIGSDAQYELLEIVPRVAEGVYLHFHDIFLPYEYPRDWVLEQHRFFNEQYLLQAFLLFNRAFEVVWASNYMATHYAEELGRAFNRFDARTTRTSSFWIRRGSNAAEPPPAHA